MRLAEQLSRRNYALTLSTDAEKALEQVAREAPDLILCDMDLGPPISGLELLERLKALRPRIPPVPVVFLVSETERERLLTAGRLAAGDYVTKPADAEALSAAVAARLARRPRGEIWPKRTMLGKREVETLTWAARGKTSAEIAQILGLSKRTVDFHIDNARNKLGVATRIQAAIKAATAQLIEP